MAEAQRLKPVEIMLFEEGSKMADKVVTKHKATVAKMVNPVYT